MTVTPDDVSHAREIGLSPMQVAKARLGLGEDAWVLLRRIYEMNRPLTDKPGTP